MELNLEWIDKQSDNVRHAGKSPMMSIQSKGQLYFNQEAVTLFGLWLGEKTYLSFANGKNVDNTTNNYWYVVANVEGKGFKAMIDKRKKNPGVRICSLPFVTMFLLRNKELKIKVGDTFYLQKTNSELNSQPIIEILTHKTVKEIMK